MLKKYVSLLILVLLSSQAFAKTTLIEKMRVWPSPEKTRIVFDMSGPVKYRVFELHNPRRLVIDFKDARLLQNTYNLELTKTHINQVRSANHVDKSARVVFDLSQKLNSHVFVLPPNDVYGHRLVVDLGVSEREAILAMFSQDLPEILNQIEAAPKEVQKAPKAIAKPRRDFIVAIDAGHGGEDPGAVGLRGTREKDVVLGIAKQLRTMLNREPGLKAVLIRKGDYYVGLRNRVMRSRKIKADFFISIHADAALNRKASGASVYTLSNRGATSAAAKYLARRENKADSIGGINIGNKSGELASVLLDLSQTSSRKDSRVAAKSMINSLSQITKMHKKSIESAGFAVLKAPDIPSILVETGFISNPASERKLKTKKYQKKLAKALFSGIKNFARAQRSKQS